MTKSLHLCLLCASACLMMPARCAAELLAITNVNVIDVVSGAVRSDQNVLIADDRITRTGPASEVSAPAGSKHIAGDGRYLIPGLWDMHVHFRNDPTKPDISLAKENSALLKLFVANGVVGVREMGGDLADSVLQWRQESEVGNVSVPGFSRRGGKSTARSLSGRGRSPS